jgi:DNA-binding response OmpR family regulator
MTERRAGMVGDRGGGSVPDDVPPPEIDALGVLRHAGSWISLTPTQENVMRALIGRMGQAVARADLAAATWPDSAPDHHAIDVHIHRLRPRLEKTGLVIHTLRGRGFMLESLGGESATRRI